MPDVFDTVQNLVAELITFKAANPTKKIAFVLSGGGARAAWFAGALESIERETRKQQPNVPNDQRLAPDIIVGTSGGALAGLGYFADLMNSGSTGSYNPYLNRQSWLWRDVSHGNEGATLLLDNPEVLELVSGSKTGTSRIDWQSAQATPTQIPQAIFQPIANIKQQFSPTYNFEMLFQSRAELNAAKQEIKDSWDALHARMIQIDAHANSFFARLPQNLTAPWLGLISTINNDLDSIRSRIDNIRGDLHNIKESVKSLDLQAAKDALENLRKDSGGTIVAIVDAIGDVLSELAQIPVTTISTQFADMQTLFNDLRGFLHALGDLVSSLGTGFEALINRIAQIALHIDDVAKFLAKTIGLMAANSSLMDTTGLKNSLHEVLRLATPTPVASDAAGAIIDAAIIAQWTALRAAKALNPNIRAPELLLTASNITAKRLALLSLCDYDTATKLAHSHTWVIALNDMSTQFLAGKMATAPGVRDPERWIFGAEHLDIFEPGIPMPNMPIQHTGSPAQKAHPAAGGPSVKSGVALHAAATGAAVAMEAVARGAFDTVMVADRPAAVTAGAAAGPSAKTGLAGLKAPGGVAAVGAKATTAQTFEFSPFPAAGTSDTTGTSLLAMAALSSAAIPFAFPPKYWRFANPVVPDTYWHHWFVDGGVCDNRPIQQALAAGADIIVSFELRPLRKAIDYIPDSEERPNFAGIASALIDTPISSSFYRFLETYVADVNAQLSQSPPIPNDKKIWRISPEIDEPDETIGVYDFNGFWHDGNLKLGLFDWFMRGYLDTHGSMAPGVFAGTGDPACESYKHLAADYGQLKNADQKPASPGFFRVDFVNNKPHPGYP